MIFKIRHGVTFHLGNMSIMISLGGALITPQGRPVLLVVMCFVFTGTALGAPLGGQPYLAVAMTSYLDVHCHQV